VSRGLRRDRRLVVPLLGAVLAVLLLGTLGALGGGMVAAADPTAAPGSPIAPSPATTPGGDVAGQVDSRSAGEGPGLQVEPLMVLIGVVLLGAAAAGGTWLYVRLTREE
jgi:hypothetical protein